MLEPSDIQRLRALGFEVALPSWLPEGYALNRVDAEIDPEYGSVYRVTWTSPGGAELFVEGTNGGLGDVMRGESRRPFQNAALGAGTLEFYEPGSEEGVDFRSHWLQSHPENPAYGLAGRGGVAPDDAVRVAESLQRI